MGLFERDRPLIENVVDRTIASATKDGRFTSVQYEELKDLRLEISVLTEPRRLLFRSPEELLSKKQPNKDGLILISACGQSTFFP
jgi:AMMECR1 domain-containing protein